MKSPLALIMGLLMMAGSLFPQTDVEEVYKIPGLFGHYQLHKREAGSGFDFWQFLDMHYSINSRHNKTPHKGVKIPLYNHLSAGFVFVLTKPTLVPGALPAEILAQETQFQYANVYQFLRAYPLLQPPQFS
jgi:hypothetical protein